MTNRIHQLFAKKKGNILSIYFTAGFPHFNDTLPILQHLDESGADLVELGFPFSDPLADGPVIQQSSQQAIKNGMTLEKLFRQLQGLRQVTQMPVVLMGYLNPILQFGEENFISACAEAGVDGIIIPDMPLSYYRENLEAICERKGISNILLITPETAESRIRIIDEFSKGFIYMVSTNSITGANKSLDLQTAYFNRIRQMNLKNPTLIGFGIHDSKTFQNACSYSRGAIIGSAFIKHLENHGVSKESISDFVNRIVA
jgi:tryptophan synthase alpha chain